jgi:hypothetical protein
VQWTDEQRAILDHPAGAHAVVRAVPGAGKTTTLVARVVRLCELRRRGRDARRYNELALAANAEDRPLTALERAEADRLRTFDRADNPVALAGGLAAGVLVVVGGVLLARGFMLRRRAGQLGVLGLPRGSGVAWSLAF